MKIKMSVVLLIIIAGHAFVYAQTDKRITAVRAEVKSIDKGAGKYTKKMKSVEGIALEGAEATYYLSGKIIRKIAAKMYGETYNATAEVYYSEGKPIFIFLKTNKYDKPIGASKAPKIVSSEEERIYFEGEKTIAILIGKNVLKPTDESYKESEKSLRELAEMLSAAFLQ